PPAPAWPAGARGPPSRGPPPVPRVRLAQVHQRRAQILTGIARVDDARAEAMKMLEYAQAEGDRRLEAEAYAELAYCHYMALSWDHVVHLEANVRRSHEIAREIGDERLLARMLFLMGSLDQMQARLTEAEAEFAESVALAQRGGHQDIVVLSQTQVSLQRNWQGRFEDSVALCLEVEHAAREIHDGFSEVF